MTDNISKTRYREPEEIVPVDDQRQEFRLTGRIWITVEIEAPDEENPSRKLRCSSSDISANGLRINASEPLPDGAILPLTIELDDTVYHLTGEVKWCFPVGGSGFVAGFALYESDQTSILEWKEAIAHLMST